MLNISFFLTLIEDHNPLYKMFVVFCNITASNPHYQELKSTTIKKKLNYKLIFLRWNLCEHQDT